MRRELSLILVSILLLSPAYAQEEASIITAKNPDNPWKMITTFDYPDYLHSVSLEESRQSTKLFSLTPANHPEVGVAMTKDIYSLSIRTALQSLENSFSNSNTGSSDVLNLRAGLQAYGGQIHAHFGHIKGHSLSNNTGTSQNPSFRDDIGIVSYGVAGAIEYPIFGKKKALFSPVDETVSRKSIWELGAAVGVNYEGSQIMGSSPFLAENQRERLGDVVNMKGIYQDLFGLYLGLQNKINVTNRLSYFLNIQRGTELASQSQQHIDRRAETSLVTGARTQLETGLALNSGRHNLGLHYRVISRKLESSRLNIDSTFYRAGVDYSLLF